MNKIVSALVSLLIPAALLANSDVLNFEENKGQWGNQFLYKLTLKNLNLYYENNSITFQLYDFHELLSNGHPKSREKIMADNSTAFFHSYRVDFVGANENVGHSGEHAATNYHNYFVGNDSRTWVSGVKLYEELNYSELYPGIRLKIYSQGLRPKHDFIVSAGSDASSIKMKYTGADKLKIENGKLVITTSLGLMTEQKPYAYQIINGANVEVSCRYALNGNLVTFDFPKGYDKNFELVIDPVLVASTYSGSFADNWGFTATYDNSGNMYAGGIVTSTGYPVTSGAYQVNFAGGGTGGIYPLPWDVAITKYNSTGSTQIFATYLGGSENDYPNSMVVNANDELYVYGKTYSSDFPITTGAFDNSYNGKSDIFVSKFSSTGSALVGSTFVGGSNDDGVNFDAYELNFGNLKFNYGDDARGEIIVDQNNDCYVASCTKSLNFPATSGAYKTTFAGGGQDACVFKLNSNMSALSWCTYLGGSQDDAAFGLALDNSNNVYAAGGTMSSNFPVTAGALNSTYKGSIDGFVSLIKNDGSALLASTFIGTTSYDQCYFVQTDKSNNAYVYGQTKGVYPTTSGVYKSSLGGLFIQKLDGGLTTTIFSTIIGDGFANNPNLSPSAFLVDNCENIYIAGWGGSCIGTGGLGSQGSTSGLPVTVNAYQKTTDGCDFYVMSLSKNAATLLYATFFGAGSPSLEHVDGGTSRFDKRGVVYQSVCGGCGASSTFPTTATAWSKTNNSNNCNNAIFKIDFQTNNVAALASTSGTNGCAPFTPNFANSSSNATGYEWYYSDGGAKDTVASPTHTFTNPGTYTVKLVATNPLSCNVKDSVTITINVYAYPVVALGADTNIVCNPLSGLTLDAKNPGDTYLWSTGVKTQTIVPTAFGKYWVRVSNNGCTSTDTINITGKITVDALASTAGFSGCAPVTVNFLNTSKNGVDYKWDFGDGSAADVNFAPSHTYSTIGVYTVKLLVKNDSTCNKKDSITVNVTVNGPPPVNLGADTNLLCKPLSSVVLDAGNVGSTYKWNTGSSAQTITPTAPGKYWVKVTKNGCSASDTITITQSPQVTSMASSTGNSGCSPYSVTFINSSTNASTYQWNFNDGSSVSTATAPTHTFTTPGTYSVKLVAKNNSSCNISDSVLVSIVVLASPTVNLGPDIDLECDSLSSLKLDAGNPGAVYLWSTGDTAQAIKPTKTGKYWVTTFLKGCSATDTVAINGTSKKGTKFLIPNVFSPNGDNVNETFKITAPGLVSDYNIKIYNRWGLLIFESSDISNPWNGKINGSAADDGTYYYILKFTSSCSKAPTEDKGFVTLLK